MHSDEVVTDVIVRRLRATAGDGTVTIAWDYPGRTLLEVLILCSRGGFAESAEEGGGAGAAGAQTADRAPSAADQTVVYRGVTGSFRDVGLENDADYFYTVFARHPEGEWQRWERLELRPARPARSASSSPNALACRSETVA